MAKKKDEMPDTTSDKKTTYDLSKIDVALLNIKKEIGEDVIIDVDTIPTIPRVKCRSPTIGYIFGAGGTPEGRIIELYGPESAGKTLIAENILADYQSVGKFVAFIDAEFSFDVKYAAIQGLDTSKDKFKLLQPNCGEDAFTMIEKLAESGQVSCIAVDSVAALLPKSEMEGTMEDQQMGAQARMIGKGLRKVSAICSKNKCTVIFLNQIRQKIGISYGDPTVTPGGAALKFWASIRCEVRKGDKSEGEDNEDMIGIVAKIINKKNKTSVPFRKGEVFISFKEGLDVCGEYLDFAVTMGHVVKGGAWYTIEGERFQGRANSIKGLKEDTLLFEKVKSKVCATLEGNPMVKIDLPMSEVVEEQPTSIKSLAQLAAN